MRALVMMMLMLSGCQLLESMTEPAPEPVTHTVQRGDTLWKISKQHGVSIDEIKAANGLSGDTIDIDQVLIIPTEGAPAAVAARPSRPRPGSGGGQRSSGGGGSVSATSSSGGLVMPAEKPCLSGPTEVEDGGDEPSMVSSAGLSRGQIKAAMDGFLGKLGRCVDGDWPVGEATVEITVACTGRVSQVVVTDRGTLPGELLGCIQETLRYAPFPAHDLPDGETFGYPLRFSGPG